VGSREDRRGDPPLDPPHGEPPAADDWSAAMTRARPEKVARLREGDWPSVPTVQNYCGSWSAAIEAAGLTTRPRWRPRKNGDASDGRRGT
jgi:hypothetical protein